VRYVTTALVAGLLAAPLTLSAQRPRAFQVHETTIAQIESELKAHRLTCHTLVQEYLKRIDAYDQKGPSLNAIVQINPEAGKEADDLDRRMASSGPVGPLHCVPMIVKDNFETIGLQSAAGSLALKGFVSTKDAWLVRRVKAAGAIVLAKSNMAEWAFSPYETVSSILPGYTKNPYALDRVTAGSSGGTAAAVAASFGAVGLGSDTGNSIRGPSSHQALVGIRSTMGLTSRAGVVPLSLLADIAGPMARTVEDAFRAAVLKTMDAEKLDAFIYPTWSNPPRLIGDLNTPHGDNSQVFSPTTGFPSINVPMGYTRGGMLPIGMTLFGRAWDEARLIRLAYSYEQSTHHRKPPASTPPLR